MERTDLLDGVLHRNPTPWLDHQDALGKLAFALKEITDMRGGWTFIAPVDVYLDDANVVQPDVIYVAPQSRCRRVRRGLEGAPDLVIEVLSPATAQRDRGDKFRLYERFGVREYWIADPTHKTLEVYVLDDDGHYRLSGVYGPDDSFACALLAGETITLAGVFDFAADDA